MTDDRRQQRYWEAEHGHRRWDHPVVRRFAEQRLDHLATLLDLASIQTALDVGCGDGFSTWYLGRRGPRVVGCDRSERMLAGHPLRADGRVVRADVTGLPFADGAFDLVFCWEVLHHVSEPAVAVAEMTRVSRRWVLVVEPNPRNLAQWAFALVDREHRWVLRYRLEWMRGLLAGAGLRERAAHSGGWIFPNRCPDKLSAWLARRPYRAGRGISNWVLGEKAGGGE